MERVALRDLPSNSRTHVARVQVVRLFEPTQNEGKARFQRVVLRDVEGDRVRLTLFGSNIDIYSSILEEDGIYDVSNVTMKSSTVEYGYAHERLMYVHNSSSVVSACTDEALSSFMPNYITIAAANGITSVDVIFDVAAVVVHVGAVEGKHTRSGQPVDMSKMHLTDDSCDAVVPVVLWGSLAHEGIKLAVAAGDRGVIAFHGLRKNIFRGEHSFTAGYDCRLLLNPQGSRVHALQEWLTGNAEIVLSRHQSSVGSEPARRDLNTETIANLNALTAGVVGPTSLYKIRASITAVEEHSIRTAFGCSHCGKGCDCSVGDKFVCSSCNRPGVCIAKLYFDFDAFDSSGSLTLCAQTRAAETILGIRANEFSRKSLADREAFVVSIRTAMLTRSYPIVLCPVPSLLRDHSIVKWAIKYVETV